VKPAPLQYLRPESREEAVAALAEFGDEAKPLAGGQSLLTLMNLRVAQPEILLDVSRAGLTGISVDDALELGATTTQNAALWSSDVARSAPLMTRALRDVGHHTLRNRGTVGGSIAHADSSAELPAVLLALGGEVVAQSAGGSRTIAADDFFVSHFTTAMTDEELLVSVRVPVVPPDAWAFHEIARRHGDFALAGVAAAFALDEAGLVTSARVALFAVDERPLRIAEVEEALLGRPLGDDAAVAVAARRAAASVEPVTDIHGSTKFRKRLTDVVVRRALHTASPSTKAT
jgi:carbon-monoxide dehydrogenase medium subunit